MAANLFQIRADRQLVGRMLAGEETAFEQFFESSFDGLYRFALPRVDYDEDLAEDVAQAAICTAIEKIDTYRGEAALFSWLCTVCRYEISARYRRLQRAPPEVELVEGAMEARTTADNRGPEDVDPETGLERRELARWVHLALDQLPPRHGQALEWKYLDGLSVKEIAQRLEVGPKAAESILTRARVAFREEFGERNRR